MGQAMSHRFEHSRAAGDTGGIPAPAGFEGYDAAREHAAVYARGPRGLLAIGGRDAVSFLHGILTNDIASLAVGRACYAAYLTPQGRMISDMDVMRRADDLLLDVEPGMGARLAERLDSSIFTEDVSISDLSAQRSSIGVYGPRAGEVLGAVLRDARAGTRLPGLDEHVTNDWTVLGTDRGGVGGFHVFTNVADAGPLTEALVGRGAARLGELAAESLRIEAGVPRFGPDMTDDTIPLEAGIEARAISTTKGCYVGQEVIVRILHRGHGRVVRKLVSLDIEGDAVPAPGARLMSEGRDAGHVTSAVRSPRLGVVAIGYVHRDFVEPGTRLRLVEPPGADVTVGARSHAR
jgi:folate-binding protein YgfZ